MPEPKVSSTDLLTHYSAQLKTDIERNTQEQDQVGAQIEELKARLLTLQHDHAVLVTMQHALENGIPFQQVPTSSGTRRTAASERGSGAGGGAAATGKKQNKPTLVGLIREYLAKQTEPCSAVEVAAALSEAHPDRTIKTTVVRTTLEGLVAKSSASRIKQGHSVFYTGVA
ncbi:hypothetical protein [Streptomyces sp. NPDC001530]|uniref:hypothetical protein n=1 Tax=Streptomyces sp. NPDC001530 TaxID=3364582 RepID=UPI0036A2E797